MGQPRPGGTFIPLALSRQELADMIGTTIETAIRIMSGGGKDNLVRTGKEGFVVVDRAALETMALSQPPSSSALRCARAAVARTKWHKQGFRSDASAHVKHPRPQRNQGQHDEIWEQQWRHG